MPPGVLYACARPGKATAADSITMAASHKHRRACVMSPPQTVIHCCLLQEVRFKRRGVGTSASRFPVGSPREPGIAGRQPVLDVKVRPEAGNREAYFVAVPRCVEWRAHPAGEA